MVNDPPFRKRSHERFFPDPPPRFPASHAASARDDAPPVGTRRKLEVDIASIMPFVNSPRGRDWLSRARWYNSKNGIKEEAVPQYLVWKFPLPKVEPKGKG